MLSWSVIALWILLGASCVTDIRSRRIPNVLILVGLVVGLFSQAQSGGLAGLGLGFLGALIGFLALVPLFALGRMGGGDVKLVMVCGAFLGWRAAIHIILVGTVAHAVLALIFALLQRRYQSGSSPALDLKKVPHAIGFTVAGVLYSLGFVHFF